MADLAAIMAAPPPPHSSRFEKSNSLNLGCATSRAYSVITPTKSAGMRLLEDFDEASIRP